MLFAQSTYHSLLRIAALCVALVMVFESGLLSQTTAQMAGQTERYLANAVGVSVGVAPTELNQITAALTEREQELAARESALTERELEIGLQSGFAGTGTDTSTFILATILFILLVLIILNYALDYIRSREEQFVT
jgi:hypothetical protein